MAARILLGLLLIGSLLAPEARGRPIPDDDDGLPLPRDVAPVVSSAATRAPCACTWPRWSELDPTQRALLSPTRYAGLERRQRAAFLNISAALRAAGLDLEGLTLVEVRRDRLLFAPEGVERLRSSLERACADGRFKPARPHSRLHPGMAESGARQARARHALQLGFGRAGAFADIDAWNPAMGFRPGLLHAAEVGWHHLSGSRTDPLRVGRALGRGVVGYTVCRAHRRRQPSAAGQP